MRAEAWRHRAWQRPERAAQSAVIAARLHRLRLDPEYSSEVTLRLVMSALANTGEGRML